MKSIKPGRGPSAMGAFGSVVVGIFGIIWTIGASSMGAPSFFVLFGVVFVGVAIIQGLYHLKNATGTNRMSLFDITDSDEEPDPLDARFNPTRRQEQQIVEGHPHTAGHVNYCPFCGNKVSDDSFKFCPNCGKEL